MNVHEPISPDIEAIGQQVVDACYKVHTALGPGLLESVYAACLRHCLMRRGVQVDSEVKLPIHFEGLHLECGLRLDLLVGNEVIIEAKAIEVLLPVHRAQLLSYLRLSGKRLGYLVNFNELRIKDGIIRMVL